MPLDIFGVRPESHAIMFAPAARPSLRLGLFWLAHFGQEFWFALFGDFPDRGRNDRSLARSSEAVLQLHGKRELPIGPTVGRTARPDYKRGHPRERRVSTVGPMQPIDFFLRACRRWPRAVAVEDQGRRLRFRELETEVLALAAGLQGLDPEAGSRVGICAANGLEHVIAWLAVLAAGKTWVPLYPRNARAETVNAIAFAEAGIAIADEASIDLVEDAGAEIVVAEGSERPGTTGALRARHAARRPKAHALPLDATQAIKFTGGTTETPKGVMQPLRAWNTNIVTQMVSWGMATGERTLIAAPMTHGTSTYILPTLGAGGTLVLADRPRPQEILGLLAERAITTVFLAPTTIGQMTAAAQAQAPTFPALRNLIYGAAPMRPAAIAGAFDVFGPTVAATYGQTEAPQIATMIGPGDLARPEKQASVGRETLLTRVAAMEADGRLLPPGEVGEVVIRGDLVMTGYWRQPEATAETLIGGWLHTGDLGAFDEDGFLFLKGRMKDVIISGGFNIYPADVESALAGHRAVRDCVAFGAPDETWGEALHAAVELEPGRTATEQELIAFAKAELGSVKAPKSIAFHDALPRNAYGKLQKQPLIEAALRARATSREET